MSNFFNDYRLIDQTDELVNKKQNFISESYLYDKVESNPKEYEKFASKIMTMARKARIKDYLKESLSELFGEKKINEIFRYENDWFDFLNPIYDLANEEGGETICKPQNKLWNK